MYKFISKSENETISFATKLASKLKSKDIIILSGDLGAGKTRFTKGILEYFNLSSEVSSPTFTIVNEYIAPNINIYHFDLYRLSSIDEFEAIGGEEYFNNGLCIIEWGELLEPILPENYIKITFNMLDENSRQLCIETFGNRFENFFKEII